MTKSVSKQELESPLVPTQRSAKGVRAPRSGAAGSGRSLLLAVTILPAVVVMVLFVAVPALEGLRISLSSWTGFGSIDFIGLANYVSAIEDFPFLRSLLTTVIYAGLSVAGIVVIATLLAAAVSARMKGSAFYRVVWFLPGIAPVTAAGVFWATAFQPGTGFVNIVLGAVGLGDAHAWLSSPTAALYPTIFVTVWVNVGFAFLLLLGSMEQISTSIYEAARIDGSGAVRTFFSITLPLIRPVLTVTAVLELIFQFNGFTVIWAMTEGGPGYATSTLPVLVYLQAFQLTRFGIGGAMAVMGGILLIVVGLFSIRLSRSRQ